MVASRDTQAVIVCSVTEAAVYDNMRREVLCVLQGTRPLLEPYPVRRILERSVGGTGPEHPHRDCCSQMVTRLPLRLLPVAVMVFKSTAQEDRCRLTKLPMRTAH